MTWQKLDWATLDRLRALFLEAPPARRDYWQTRADLEAYDLTYGQRIAWKWDAVLRELARLGWQPPQGPLLDWGCGSGVAGRRLLEHFGPERFDRLWLHDRSALAVAFAVETARQQFPGLAVEPAPAGGLHAAEPVGLLVLSHVLNELTAEARAGLLRLLDRARAVIWVEAGTREISRQLGALRDHLRARFRLVAPCTHQAPCGLLQPGQERHWCHFFAEPPAAIMADPDWVRFARRAGLDLRSLPYCYLVLERSETPGGRAGDAAGPGGSRILGRPRFYKGLAKVFSCQAEGVRDLTLRQRAAPELFRKLAAQVERPAYRWRLAAGEIVGAEPADPG